MVLEEDIKKISGKLDRIEKDQGFLKSELDQIKKDQRYLRSNMPGCMNYIMVCVAAIAGVESCERTQEILDKYQKAPQVRVENVIGREAPEKFYDLNGQRVYLEIDGEPVEQYVKEK